MATMSDDEDVPLSAEKCNDEHGPTRTISSWPKGLPELPIDEVFKLNDMCRQDSDPRKVDLTIGIYRTNAGQPWLLPSVIDAERHQLELDDIFRHEYLAPQGDGEFLDAARDLVFSDKPCKREALERIVSVQTVSGTGAVHIGAALLAKFYSTKRVWISDPTWNNHHQIFGAVGFESLTYRYIGEGGQKFSIDSMLASPGNNQP